MALTEDEQGEVWTEYLENVIELPEEAILAIVEQGYDRVSKMNITSDDVDNLVRTVRKPGGAQQGVPIGELYVLRLKQIAFYVRYIDLVQRDFDGDRATVEILERAWRFKREIKDRAKNEEYPEKFTTGAHARECIENMINWIGSSYGNEDLPLAYVVRDEVYVELDGDDVLGLGEPTFDEEMIRRAEHSGEVFNANNYRIWNMIRHCTHGTVAWPFVRTFSASRNGRGALFALKTQYLSGEFVNKVKLEAESQLETLFWSGKAWNFSWDQFTSRMTSAFEDLSQYGEPKSEEEKVRRLLRAIKDPTLQSAVVVVRSQTTYNSSFSRAIDFLGGEVSRNTSSARIERGVSSLQTGRPGVPQGRGRGNGHGRGRGSGRFGGRGGGGRGRGRNSGRGRGGRFSESGVLLNNGGYPRDIWNSFTREERDYVNNLRSDNPTRNVSAVNSSNGNTEETPAQRQRTDDHPGVGNDMTRRGANRS
jgi:hypothetical protein